MVVQPKEAEFLDACSLSRAEIIRLSQGSDKDRHDRTVPISQVTTAQVTALQPLTFVEHVACVIFLSFGVPNGVFTVPCVTYLIGWMAGNVGMAYKILLVLLLPLAILPQPFVPSTLSSWMAVSVLKYFSFRFAFEHKPEPPPKDGKNPRPQILVAPPHGVFPYGNILAMLVWPMLMGHHFLGLAANSALRPPIFKQILRSIGVIDASRSSARKALENYPYTIGISTGGVAEVFETNHEHECILLKERVGLIKLAIRTGADLVPCYLFGNTEIMSCWAGEGIPGGRAALERFSRKVAGFALVLIFGRFGLPIPRRIPILGIKGKPIVTAHLKCEEPTKEQIQVIQDQLIKEMHELFERYKGLYGWEDRDLIIRCSLVHYIL